MALPKRRGPPATVPRHGRPDRTVPSELARPNWPIAERARIGGSAGAEHLASRSRCWRSGAKLGRDDVELRRFGTAGGRLDVSHAGEGFFEPIEQRPFRTALEHFAHERAARRQDLNGKF